MLTPAPGKPVVALRMRVFAWVNGDEGIPIPGPLVDTDAVRARSTPIPRQTAGAGGPPSPTCSGTGSLLGRTFTRSTSRRASATTTSRAPPDGSSPGREAEVAALTERCTARASSTSSARTDAAPGPAARSDDADLGRVLLRARVRRALPVDARGAHRRRTPTDVITALKCCGLRHMDKRDRLTRFLRATARAAGQPAQPLPDAALARGAGVVPAGRRSSTPRSCRCRRRSAHLLLALAQHPEVQQRLAADPEDHVYCGPGDRRDRCDVIRCSASRTGSRPMRSSSPGRRRLPAGSVLCFNYPEFHAHRLPASRRLRPRSVAAPGPARGELHPVRGHGEPALSGARCRSAHHVGGRTRGVAALRAAVVGDAHPLSSQPRAVLAGAPEQPRPASAACRPAGVHAHPRPVGGPVAQPGAARSRHLHGGRRSPATPRPAVLRAGSTPR